MRVIVMVKANEEIEGGALPSEEDMSQMLAFNEELVKAGVLLAAEGLHPSSRGVRVVFSGPDRKVVDGPFAETKELLAGYWLWQVRSMDEAVEWAKRIPNPTGVEGVVEIREVVESGDLGESPELREKEERLRRETETRR
jgi:hypothetical protein